MPPKARSQGAILQTWILSKARSYWLGLNSSAALIPQREGTLKSACVKRGKHFLTLFLHPWTYILLHYWPTSKIWPQMRRAGTQHHTQEAHDQITHRALLARALIKASFLLQALPNHRRRNTAKTTSFVALFLFWGYPLPSFVQLEF